MNDPGGGQHSSKRSKYGAEHADRVLVHTGEDGEVVQVNYHEYMQKQTHGI